MITFLPMADFKLTATVLDYKRLGKQRIETLQLLRKPTIGTPLGKMWKNHTNCLVAYGVTLCREWRMRGYKDTQLEIIQAFTLGDGSFDNPKWLGDERLHSNHRARLLQKDPIYYGQFGWKEQPALNYWYPLEALL